MRYKYYTNNKNIVVCESSFAGKKVRGVAKCSSEDKFELNYGMLLAKARVDYKISKMRVKKANTRIESARNALDDAGREYSNATRYLTEACDEESRATEALKAIVELSKYEALKACVELSK